MKDYSVMVKIFRQVYIKYFINHQKTTSALQQALAQKILGERLTGTG